MDTLNKQHDIIIIEKHSANSQTIVLGSIIVLLENLLQLLLQLDNDDL